MAVSIRQQQFTYYKASKGVTDPQLTHGELQTELPKLDKTNLVMFIRAYVQERTPAAFASQPMLWEAVREWFAKRLDVHPREIGLSGSAQSGFSLKAAKRGVPFDPNSSDLDLFLVSEKYLARLDREIRLFISSNSGDSNFAAQAETVERQLRMGYVDLNQIPANHDKYPILAAARNDVSIIVARLRLHNFNLKPSHLRVYRNWGSLGDWVRRSYATGAGLWPPASDQFKRSVR